MLLRNNIREGRFIVAQSFRDFFSSCGEGPKEQIDLYHGRRERETETERGKERQRYADNMNAVYEDLC